MSLFSMCSNLISVDFSNLDTSEMTNMESIFALCSRVKNVTFGPNFSTSKSHRYEFDVFVVL